MFQFNKTFEKSVMYNENTSAASHERGLIETLLSLNVGRMDDFRILKGLVSTFII